MTSPNALILGHGDLHPFAKVQLSNRDSVQHLLRTLLDPLQPFFSPAKARVRVPGGTGVRFDQTAAEVEGICRPLWGLGFLLAGGGSYEHTNAWIEGIKAGTDPESPEFWGNPRDNDQRMVEMCPLGVALAIAPQLWQGLSEKERGNVEQWLGNSINSKKMPDTNWLWFRVFANLGLKLNKGKYSEEKLQQDIKHLESFYRGGGWSNDGPECIHQMDYYSSSFAIQFLQLIYAKLAGAEDPDRAKEFKERARLMALDLVHYFDDEGRAIPFGRSMIYRFAVVSFWGALAYADVELPAPLTWGVVKGIVLRHFRWWQTQPDIWSPSGTLTIGYSYPNMYMAESYNSPGSPYWACVAFICLAVPQDHPFWTSEEMALPKSLPKVKAIEQPKHIISSLGGHNFLLSSGQACGYPMKGTHAKYGAFAYSSAFGYSVSPGYFTLGQYALASQLGFSDDDGEFWKTRRLSDYSALESRDSVPVLVSVWRPFPDVKVKTILIPPREETPNWHLRVHYIEAGRDVQTADGSFAIANTRRLDGRHLDPYDINALEGTFPRYLTNYDARSQDGYSSGVEGAFAVSKGAVGIRALEPSSLRRATLVEADANSNVMESRTVIPTLEVSIPKGQSALFITGIYAKPEGNGVNREDYLNGWQSLPEVPQWVLSKKAS